MLRTSLLLLLAFLASCSSNNVWVNRHPAYPIGMAMGETAMPDLGDRWIVTQGSWFAEHLKLQPSQVYDTLGNAIREYFSEATSAYLPSVVSTPAPIYDSLPETESQKIDTRVYIRGRFPAQGQVIQIDNFSPPTLLLIHELTLGSDLVREKLYDFEKANLDSEGQTRKVKRITALVSWTLWDNYNQRPLVSGISEYSLPWEKVEGPDLRKKIHAILGGVAQQMACQIRGGCQ